jgi:hypothetical protein
MILPVVLYGCGMWSVTLSKNYILKVSEDSLLRRKFGSKREKMSGG